MKILISLIFFCLPVFSQFGDVSFGKNKVQYETFDWKYVSTINFDVYFHQGGEDIAKFSAVELEKALARISMQLNYKLQNRISVIMFNSHNQFQQNNVIDQFFSESVGGVTGLLKNRIVMPFQGSYGELRHLIGHELVHGVLNDMFHGGSLQNSITQGGFFIPTWMNEGFAEYSSIGGLDIETDMFMRDLVISESLPELRNISGYLSYRAGQTFYWYLEQNYGAEKVGELLNRIKSTSSVEKAFESSFKMSLEEFSEKWQRDIKKYFLPDVETFVHPNDYAEPVTNRKKMMNFYNSSPAISPDGEKMAFISDNDGLLGLSVMKVDDMKSKRDLISSFRKQDFEDLNLLTPGISWNSEGTKIAISAKSGAYDDVYIVDERTEDYIKLNLQFKSIGSTKWSPDNKYLVFRGLKDDRSDIYLYEFYSKKIIQLTNDLYSDEMPSWSKDSKYVYFISDRENNLQTTPNLSFWNIKSFGNDIYKIGIEDKKIERITFDPENEKTSIELSPDDKKMFFISDKNGISNLYLMDLETKKIKPVTNSLTSLNQISLSRDGTKLLFGTQVNSGYDIYLLRYPLEKDLKLDELPLTKLRMATASNDSLQLTDENLNPDIDTNTDDSDKLFSYGDYEIDFEDNKMVDVNPKAQKYDFTDITSPVEVDTNFKIKDYKIKLTPDIVYAAPSYNTFYGANGAIQFMLSDEMGNHKISGALSLFRDLNNSFLFAQYDYVENVIDYKIAGYHFSGLTQLNNFANSLFRFRNFGLNLGASLPFDLFNRIEANIGLQNISMENTTNVGIGDVSNFLVVPEIKFVHDNSLGYLYSPIIGNRYMVRVFGSPKLGSSGLGFISAEFDYRQYYSMLSGWLNLAGRFAGGASFGPEPLTYRMGGTSNWINTRIKNGEPFSKPQDFAFMQFPMPMRGWQIRETEGTKYFLTNLELRFPLFQALLAGPIPILIQGVQGAFFMDLGGTFNDDFVAFKSNNQGQLTYNDLLMSTGIGIRSVLFGIPLKVDIAWRNEFDAWSMPEYLFSIGLDF